MTPGPKLAKAKAGLTTQGQLEKDKQKEKDKKVREKKVHIISTSNKIPLTI